MVEDQQDKHPILVPEMSTIMEWVLLKYFSEETNYFNYLIIELQ